jgi:hypothetical protein
MKQAGPYLKGFVLLMGLTLLFACNPDDDNPSPNTNVADDSGENTVDPPIVEPPISEKITKELPGDWTTGCLVLKDGGTLMTTWSFTQSDFSLKQTQYSDDSCKDAKDKPLERSGTYAIGNEVTSSEGYTAYEIDLKQSGGTSKSLVALKDDKLLLNLGNDEGSRPSDFNGAFEYTKGGGESPTDTTSKDLEGRWGTACIDTDDGKSGFLGYDFKKGKFTETIVLYSDANCKTEDKKLDLPGKTVIGEIVTTDDGYTATELDLKFDDGDVDKLLYATGKTDSGRDAIVVSRASKDGSRPANLEPAISYFKEDDSNHSIRSREEELGFPGYTEIQGYALTPDMTLEFKEKREREVGASERSSRDFSQKLQMLHDLLPNQEGLRSGNW